MKLQFLEIAAQEMEQSSVFYEKQKKGLGTDFLARLADALRQCEEFPESGTLVAPNVRRMLVSRFPFGVYYRIQDEEIIIVAVGHLRRKSGFWRKR
jgi:plasmid stabilization system protein ParE